MTWLAMRARAVADGIPPEHFRPGGPASSYRTIDQQRELAATWAAKGAPQMAARPGTSNHGWGRAVDIPFEDAKAWLRRNAGRFGWSNVEGARIGESWHWTYDGASRLLLARLRRDPLAGYTRSERRWIREHDHLTRTGRDTSRRRVLERVMREQRQRIWRAAQPRSKGGDGRGWTRLRRRRYRSLRKRT